MIDEIKIINDDVEIENFLPPNVAPAYRVRYFLSYHPQAFRLIIINPSDKIKADYEKITEAIIKIPGFREFESFDRDIDIRLLDDNKKMINWYNMDIDDNTLDFRSDVNVEEITETIVYFYYYDEKNFYKFNSYKSTVVDKRTPEKFIHPVPESIERIGNQEYVPCVTQEFKEIPKEKIPHDKIFLLKTILVERIKRETTKELIILPRETTIDQSNELQLGDVDKYKAIFYGLINFEHFLTLQEYEQHIEESKQKFKGITLTSKTKNGFNMNDIIYRFELTEQINTSDYVMITGGRYLGLCDAAFRDSILEKGFDQVKIFDYKRRYIGERSYAYYFNNNDKISYTQIAVQYFGVEKVLKYGHIINNALFIEVDKDLYIIHAPIVEEGL